VTTPAYDQDFWEQLWARTLREHADGIARRAPNAHLIAETSALTPGRALDAGCGHGSETLWLAARGWQVTAVDFSAAALRYGRSAAESAGAQIAARVAWVEADLGSWTPQTAHFDLVASLYVNMADSVAKMVQRMAAAVTPGGTLLLVGHQPIDPATGEATPAAGQQQVSVSAAVAALDPAEWEIVVAEDRVRAAAGSGVDAVIRALRR
jgi:SAM-dependent methyltransferase